MNNFFNPDNPVTVVLTRLFDLILLNICFVITTIPVFTAGASLTAMYSVTLRMADGEWGYTAKHYFDAFRREFRQVTMLWLLVVFDISAMIYVFPMLARYEQTNGQLIRNAILLARVFSAFFRRIFHSTEDRTGHRK